MEERNDLANSAYNEEFRKIDGAIAQLLNQGLKPSVRTIKKQLGLRGRGKEQVIDYYLHIWEQRHAPVHLDDIKRINKIDSHADQQNYIERSLQLEESLAMTHAAIEATVDCLLIISKEGKIIGHNQKFIDLYRIPKRILASKDEAAGLQYVFNQILDPEELASLVTAKYKDPVGGHCGEMLFKDGRVVERYYQPQILNGEVMGHVWSFRDISQRKMHERNLKLKQRAIDSSVHGIIIAKIKNEKLFVDDVNPAFLNLTKYEKNNLIAKNLIIFFKKYASKFKLESLKSAIEKEDNFSCETLFKCKSGDKIWCELDFSPVKNENNIVDHYICTFVDVSERKYLEQELLHKVTHDSLTSLPNRTLILDRISQNITLAKRMKSYFAVFFLDLDNFKVINDTLGHSQGDLMLKAVSKRLDHCIRAVDTVGRLGGDEFFVVSTFFDNKKSAFKIAEKLLDVFKKPFKIDDHEFSVTTSIGGCIFPDDGKKVELLVQHADIAMYQAKAHGKNNFRFFQEKMNTQLVKRTKISDRLRVALREKEMYAVYQPILDLKTGKLLSVEALVRFDFFQEFKTHPGEVVDVAEESGLIHELGFQMLRKSCEEIRSLNEKMKLSLRLSVNVSAAQMREGGFVNKIKSVVRASKLKKSLLTLELTESMLISPDDKSVLALRELEASGFRFSLDDFGTGYSSLSYLDELPIAKLKIDKSFVDKIKKDDSSSEHLIKAIISMSHSLGKCVIAEGIEHDFQADYLRQLGCDEVQGFYYSKPLKFVDLKQWVEQF